MSCTISSGDLPISIRWEKNGNQLEASKEIINKKRIENKINSLFCFVKTKFRGVRFKMYKRSKINLKQFRNIFAESDFYYYLMCLECPDTIQSIQ